MKDTSFTPVDLWLVACLSSRREEDDDMDINEMSNDEKRHLERSDRWTCTVTSSCFTNVSKMGI